MRRGSSAGPEAGLAAGAGGVARASAGGARIHPQVAGRERVARRGVGHAHPVWCAHLRAGCRALHAGACGHRYGCKALQETARHAWPAMYFFCATTERLQMHPVCRMHHRCQRVMS